MTTEDWIQIAFYFVLPFGLALRFHIKGGVIAFLACWVLFGVCVELSWIGCRPGWEPLRSIWAFVAGLVLFSIVWIPVFAVTRAGVLFVRHMRTERHSK